MNETDFIDDKLVELIEVIHELRLEQHDSEADRATNEE